MRKRDGFSAVELLVVVTVILILAAVTIPNLARVLSIYRVKGSAEGLAAQLNLARQQAIGQGKPIAVFFDPSNSRVFVDLNRNGVPDGVKNARVLNRSTNNEEYDLPPSITLSVSGGSGCFTVPSSVRGVVNPVDDTNAIPPPNNTLAAPELGIANYNGWFIVVFDSRGELLLDYRQANSTCINSSLTANPAGAVVISCKQTTKNIKFSLSLSLRGGVSVLTY
ncbi:MAG: GspH/FimT family pseudopilin [Acidobacteria bacterium]|nr:GspH/FimT family pseudopilin [Acidobacteriota bacterium]